VNPNIRLTPKGRCPRCGEIEKGSAFCARVCRPLIQARKSAEQTDNAPIGANSQAVPDARRHGGIAPRPETRRERRLRTFGTGNH
jgi:hypothetical protein